MEIQAKEVRYGSEAAWDAEGMHLTRGGRVIEGEDGHLDFDEPDHPNPEMLLTGAHVTCYLSALASVLDASGWEFEKITARSLLTLTPQKDGSYRISDVELQVEAKGSDEAGEHFAELSAEAEKICPVSGALRRPHEIRLTTDLL